MRGFLRGERLDDTVPITEVSIAPESMHEFLRVPQKLKAAWQA